MSRSTSSLPLRTFGRACLIIGIGLLAGCTAAPGGTQAPLSPGSTAATAPSLPACVAASLPPRAELLPGFPTTLPMPPGTYVTGARQTGAQLVVDAIVPTPLAQAAGFMTTELPKAGWTITSSDAEQDEAEARFSGPGFTGRFRLHGMTGCNDAVTFTVSVSPS